MTTSIVVMIPVVELYDKLAEGYWLRFFCHGGCRVRGGAAIVEWTR